MARDDGALRLPAGGAKTRETAREKKREERKKGEKGRKKRMRACPSKRARRG